MNSIMVLAMVPGIQCGIALNLGLPIGLVAGLIGGLMTIEYGIAGWPGFLFAIAVGAAIAAVGIGCVWLPVDSEVVALAGFVIIGLGFAPIYPCIIHSTPCNFGKENSGAIIGIQMASAYVGCTFMSPLYGLLGRTVGFGILPAYLALFLVLMVFMTEKTFRITSEK